MSSLAHNLGRAHRRDLYWIAALVHRLSGVLLACFLPFHFLALALVLNGRASFDGFLRWTEQPLVEAAEGVLVFLLTVHLVGGLRLLLIEYGVVRPGRKELVALGFGAAAILGISFYLGLA